jgi:HSP20 family protein
MGFLMRKNARGIVSGDVMLHDLVRNLFPDFSDRAWRDLIPESKMSVKMEKNCVKVWFACPGCKKSDFDVETSGRFLTVKVAKRTRVPAEEGDKHYSCCERSWEEIQESTKLPAAVIPSEAKATYSDGVLEITLPRSSEELPAAKQITVQ